MYHSVPLRQSPTITSISRLATGTLINSRRVPLLLGFHPRTRIWARAQATVPVPTKRAKTGDSSVRTGLLHLACDSCRLLIATQTCLAARVNLSSLHLRFVLPLSIQPLQSPPIPRPLTVPSISTLADRRPIILPLLLNRIYQPQPN